MPRSLSCCWSGTSTNWPVVAAVDATAIGAGEQTGRMLDDAHRKPPSCMSIWLKLPATWGVAAFEVNVVHKAQVCSKVANPMLSVNDLRRII